MNEITVRELRQALFNMPDNMTVAELRRSLFEVEDQDKPAMTVSVEAVK